MSSLTLGSEAIETPVCKEHGAEIKFFCKTHMAELCLTCKLMKHKRCDLVVSLGQAAKEVHSEVHCNKIGGSLGDLLAWFTTCKERSESEKQTLNGQKQNAIDNVKHTRKTLDSYMDKLEAAAIKDVEEVCESIKKILDDQIHICESAMSSLQKQQGCLNTTISIGNVGDRFIEVNKATRDARQYCSILGDMRCEMHEVNVVFDQNALQTLKNALPKLGSVECVKTGITVSLPGQHIIYNHGVTIQTNTDNKDSYIVDYEVLADERQLVIDWANRKLKLLDKHANIISELFFKDTTYGLVNFVVQNSEVIVSTSSHTLLVVEITGRDMFLKQTRRADVSIGAMVKFEENILAITWYNNEYTILVIDTEGHAKRSVSRGHSFKRPYFITYKNDTKTIYVLDLDNGLYAISIQGQVMFNYRDPMVKEYFGLAVSRDHSFIGVKRTGQYEVRILNRKGNVLEDLSFRNLFPLNVVDQKLVLGSFSNAQEHGTVVVYSLME